VGWGFPGGGREPGETIDATVARELWEEANARPMETRLLGALGGVAIDDQGLVAAPIDHHALLWARVELDEFTGAHETLERRIVSARDVDGLLMLPYPGLLDLAARVDPLLDWDEEPR
jgi:8-oxo-dGTP pyrophosphatase MutT (NUDIX family)